VTIMAINTRGLSGLALCDQLTANHDEQAWVADVDPQATTSTTRQSEVIPAPSRDIAPGREQLPRTLLLYLPVAGNTLVRDALHLFAVI
jgi:hypothetical protein